MAFASGKHALAICDRCGFEYPYRVIRQEWNGSRVCPECFETKHPQLDPPRIRADAEALRDARPARIEPQVVFVGFADSPFVNVGAATGAFDLRPSPVNKQVIGLAQLGTFEVTADAVVLPTGVAAAASLGNEGLETNNYIPVTGVSATGSIGLITLPLKLTGVSAVAGVGTVGIANYAQPAGVVTTTALGTPTVYPLFYGEGGYGEAAWDGYQ